MKNKKRFLGLFLLYTKLCADIGEASLSDLSDNFQVIIDPLNKAVLSAQLSVPVKKIHKKLGDSFNKGDVLLELDSAVYVAQMKKARAVVEKAQNTYKAKEELFDARIASLSELKEAYALWATAQAELEVSKKQLEACKIVAPYRGKVANVLLFEHELPQVGQPLVEVVGDEVLLAKMLVDAKYLPQISIDKTIDIYINELKQTLTARIKRIGSVIDPASATIAVEAEIENTDSYLISGMTGITTFSIADVASEVRIESKPVKSALLEVPYKTHLTAKTILQDEGNFDVKIQSGTIPKKFAAQSISLDTSTHQLHEDQYRVSKEIQIEPLVRFGEINPILAERERHEEPSIPLLHHGRLDPVIADNSFENRAEPSIALVKQGHVNDSLSSYYQYEEPKKNYAPINYSGNIDHPLAESSVNTEIAKPTYYTYEGNINDKLPMIAQEEQNEKDSILYQGDLNDQLAQDSIKKSNIDANLYRIVKEAEELDQFEKRLIEEVNSLTYIPVLKPKWQAASLPVESDLNEYIAQITPGKEKVKKEHPIVQQKSHHKNDHIASVDKAIKKLPKSVYHQSPLSYEGDLNDPLYIKEEPIAITDTAADDVPENDNDVTLEQKLEPLSYIPEINEVKTPHEYDLTAYSENEKITALQTELKNLIDRYQPLKSPDAQRNYTADLKHQETLQESLNETISAKDKNETLEQKLEPLSYIPELSATEYDLTAYSENEKINALQIELQNLIDRYQPLKSLDTPVNKAIASIPKEEATQVSLQEPVAEIPEFKNDSENEKINALVKELQNLIDHYPTIKEYDILTVPSLEWKESFIGGGSGGKDAEASEMAQIDISYLEHKKTSGFEYISTLKSLIARLNKYPVREEIAVKETQEEKGWEGNLIGGGSGGKEIE